MRPHQPPRAGRRADLRQGGVLQPGRLGQGPAGAQHHRGGRARRRPQARPDRGRGDQRQHRHRPRHGLRRQGLSAGGDHGRQLLGRAAQADALPRRQGRADAARAKGLRHVPEGEGAGRGQRLVPRPPVRDRRPTPRSTRTPPAREILADFEGDRLDYFVTGYGTGGTVTGVGRVLRKERPETKIVLSEPANAQLVGSGTPQERSADGAPAESHPAFEPHPIQGWTPDFIPLVLQEAIDGRLLRRADPGRRRRTAWTGRAKLARARKASSPAFPAARPSPSPCRSPRRPRRARSSSCMLPDTGERYLSTPLFEGIEEDMNEEEAALSRIDARLPDRSDQNRVQRSGASTRNLWGSCERTDRISASGHCLPDPAERRRRHDCPLQAHYAPAETLIEGLVVPALHSRQASRVADGWTCSHADGHVRPQVLRNASARKLLAGVPQMVGGTRMAHRQMRLTEELARCAATPWRRRKACRSG